MSGYYYRGKDVQSTLLFLVETNLLGKVDDYFRDGSYEYVFQADDYDAEELKPILVILNNSLPFYQFELVEKYGGHAWDLIVADVRAKKIHDANLSDKTLGDAYHEAFSDEGIQSTIMFHQNMDKKLTEKEYQKAVDGYKAFISVMEEDLND